IPQDGGFKGNLAAGGRGVAKDISNNQLKIANAVSQRLSEHGIDFAGIDIIGNYLTEINITCPTCACEIYDQTGENPIEVYLKENE
ncbi:MAG: glutathione synthase, partial [Gammaproteobacteria bacterium]